MRRSYDDDDYRSKNMSTHDYHDHISRLARMPSAVTTDVPRYGLAPRFYHTPKNVTSHETVETKQEDHHNNNNNNNKQNKKQHQQPQFEEKAEIFEYDNSSTTNDEDVKSTNTVNNQVSEESSINDVASSYIQQKRKAFELCKWKTFSVR
ncbi:hypothetical protein TorRG33x02_074440 [Trema orientale]|uniref:Uncharacterized protein n=1 Tax=Trema orientale TaxID=63057 RepID=A0A2P5FG18_TREOI|nr:hypothetical protein TorRG33x02_074440 [Trema orientale]